MRKFFFLAFLLPLILWFNHLTQAQAVDSVKVYIDSALYYMQTKALTAKGLDWTKIKDSAYIKAATAQNIKEAFPALVYAFKQLKDYHGVVANGVDFYRYPSPVNFSEVLSAGIKKEFLKGNRIVTAMLDKKMAYLRVPAMQVVEQKQIEEKATMLRDSLCMLLDKSPKGIILDLRMNAGGNSVPMLSGIGPLFESSLVGYSVDREGKFQAAIQLKEGVAVDEQGNKRLTIKNTCRPGSNLPIAVLIGPSTVSSGEILAAFLKAQSNVHVFGEPTPGFCNATEGFLFMKDQGYLLLSVSRIADSQKHVYQDMIVRPHVYVKSQDNYEHLPTDPTVKAALQWLESHYK